MQMNRLSSTAFDKMIIESIDEVYCFDRETDEILFVFDQIRNGELTSESDVVYSEGRQGVQLAAFDRNKTAGFSCENGYVQAGAIAVQLGTDLEEGDITYEIMENITAKSGGVVELSESPDGGESGVVGVYKINSDGAPGARLAGADYTFTAASGDGHAKITITDGSGGYLVHYKSKTSTGKMIINSGDEFSNNIRLVINFVAQEPCGGNKYLMQCVMPNAKATGQFSLSAGDNPAVHNFEASALYDVCSEHGELFTIKMV